jgi:transposase
MTRVWAKKGSRPTAAKQTKHEWVYLDAAIEPARTASVALQASHVSTGTMNVFLKMMSAELGPREHAMLIMDHAGWHKSKNLRVPDNITVLYLPPYSPELNPVERLLGYLRSHHFANRVYDGYDHLLAATAQAWQLLTPARLQSTCRCTYLTPELVR